MNVKLTKEQKIRVEDSKDIACLMRQVVLRDNRHGANVNIFLQSDSIPETPVETIFNKE